MLWLTIALLQTAQYDLPSICRCLGLSLRATGLCTTVRCCVKQYEGGPLGGSRALEYASC